MIWTLLACGIILLWVLGMILAARLGAASLPERGRLDNCRRGAIRPSWKSNPGRGATSVPKGPR